MRRVAEPSRAHSRPRHISAVALTPSGRQKKCKQTPATRFVCDVRVVSEPVFCSGFLDLRFCLSLLPAFVQERGTLSKSPDTILFRPVFMMSRAIRCNVSPLQCAHKKKNDLCCIPPFWSDMVGRGDIPAGSPRRLTVNVGGPSFVNITHHTSYIMHFHVHPPYSHPPHTHDPLSHLHSGPLVFCGDQPPQTS